VCEARCVAHARLSVVDWWSDAGHDAILARAEFRQDL
jgi:hypothetical protein